MLKELVLQGFLSSVAAHIIKQCAILLKGKRPTDNNFSYEGHVLGTVLGLSPKVEHSYDNYFDCTLYVFFQNTFFFQTILYTIDLAHTTQISIDENIW